MTRKQALKKYAAEAVRLGAIDAKPISTATVRTAAWVRLKCQYGCSGYGGCLTCPPYSPSPEQTARLLRGYHAALMIHGDGNVNLTRIAVQLERRIFLDGYYKAFALGAGPCSLCRTCDLEGCRHPERARPSMEAAGIDVYQTARGNHFPIQVVTDSDCRQNYYCLILVE